MSTITTEDSEAADKDNCSEINIHEGTLIDFREKQWPHFTTSVPESERVVHEQTDVEIHPWDSIARCVGSPEAGSATSSNPPSRVQTPTTETHRKRTEELRASAVVRKKRAPFDGELATTLSESLQSVASYLEHKKATATTSEADKSFVTTVALHLQEMDEQERKEKKRKILEILFS